MITDCVFCRILNRELKSTVIDEGEHCWVVLDRNQAARGHLLVIPKQHLALWHELEHSVVAEMTLKAHRWSRVLVELLQPEGYNLLMNNGAAAGQDVFHAHLHITPRSFGDGYYQFGGRHQVLADSDASALGALLRQAFSGDSGVRP